MLLVICIALPCDTETVKNEPAMQETRVRSLGQKDPLEREWQLTLVFLPDNPMERGVWQAIVHGVAKSQTRLNNTHTHTHTQTDKY